MLFCAIILVTLTWADAQRSCVENANSSPRSRARFSDAGISAICRKEENWVSKAARRGTLSDLLNSKQMKWLESVQDCDVICLCKGVPGCQGLLRAFGNIDGIKKIVKTGGKAVSGLLKRLGRRGRRRRQAEQLGQLLEELPAARRKEYRMLSDQERRNFHDNLNRLKNDRVDGMSKYDILVVYHRAENSPGAHFGPAFLPFHRELLKHLETALRMQDPNVALAYWDSTLDDGLPDPTDSVIWSPEFLGNGNGVVNTGPFSSWSILDHGDARAMSPSLRIVRDLGRNEFGSLLKASDVQQVLGTGDYRGLTFCVDPYFELVHGAVHMWVGGLMDPLELSPYDPIFFMLHAHVDYIWDTWRRQRQTPEQRETEYPPDYESCNNFHYAQNEMRPFKIKNIEGMKDMDELFTYEPSPTCSPTNPNCGSPYVFCNPSTYTCKSKVVMGGNCQGFEGTDICLFANCVQGRCSQGQPPTLPPPPTTPIWIPPTTVWIPPTTVWVPPTTVWVPPPTTFPPLPNTVWFPITVQKYTSRFSGATDAVIRARDVSTGQIFSGSVSRDTQYPFYPGAAFVQAPNPATGPVEVELEVTGADGSRCTAMCLSRGTMYLSCNPTVTLSDNPQDSPVPFTAAEEQAPFLMWDDSNQRRPDPFMFFCR